MNRGRRHDDKPPGETEPAPSFTAWGRCRFRRLWSVWARRAGKGVGHDRESRSGTPLLLLVVCFVAKVAGSCLRMEGRMISAATCALQASGPLFHTVC